MKNAVKIIGLILIVFTFTACNKPADVPRIEHTVYNAQGVPTPLPSNVKLVDEKDVIWKDPAYFGGCGFGRAFMSFIKTQNYETALKFTCQGSIQEHGASNIIKFYKNLRINYTLHQSAKVIGDGDTITMRYTTQEYATSKYKDFVIVVENDTCKLVLPHNLNEFLK